MKHESDEFELRHGAREIKGTEGLLTKPSFRRALLVVFGFILSLFLLLGVVLYLLDDDDYRQALIWSVDYFLDSQLEIEGAFSVDFGSEVQLAAESVRLKANNGSYNVTAGKLDAQLRFGTYLRTGTFWISNLSLSDLHVEIIDTETETGQEYDWRGFSLLPVVLEKVQLRNLSLAYTESDQQNAVKLSSLVIDDDKHLGTMKVSAAGVMNARPFKLEGTLGALAQLSDMSQPYPIDLSVTSETLDARVSGGIDDPIAGEGLNLQLLINDSEPGRTLNTFYKDIPVLGSLKSTASMRGDYDAPRLENIDISLQRDNKIEMTLRGNIARLAQMEGVHFDATLKAAALTELSELLNTSLPALGPINASATITANGKELSFDDIKFKAGSIDKPVITAHGSAHSTLPDDNRIQLGFDVAAAELIHAFSNELTPHNLGHLQGTLKVADVDGRWGIKEIHLVSASTDLYQLRIDGVVDDLKKFDKVKLQSELEVPDPAALGEQLGIDLTGYSPYQTKGVLTGNKNQFSYQGRASIGRTMSDTALTVSMVRDKPLIQGKLTIPQLYLSDIGINQKLNVQTDNLDKDETANSEQPEPKQAVATGKPKTVPVDNQTIFDRKSLNFDKLQSFNLDIDISIDQITGADYLIDRLAGHVKLTDGVLRLSPIQLTFEGGETDLEFELDARNTPSVSLKVTADNLLLDRLISEVQKEVPIKGKTNLHIDINSNGRSAHELASSLSGSAGFSLENARLPRIYVEYLSADALGWVLRTTTSSDPYARLDCVMVGFDIAQGVATSNLMIADGPGLLVQGTTTLDLDNETIDMVLLPEQKTRLYSRMTSVKVKGSLMDPDVEALPDKTAAASIGATVLAPGVVIPVYLFENYWPNWGDSETADTGCAKLIAEQKAK